MTSSAAHHRALFARLHEDAAVTPTTTAKRWSVLVIDLAEHEVEPLVHAVEALGLRTEAVLRPEPDSAVYFVQLSETRSHDERSFCARAAEVDACARERGGSVADWSVRAA